MYMRRFASSLIGAVALAAATPAWAQVQPLPAPPGSPLPAPEPTRGRLLYETHCVACHNSQMHWRDKRIVRDWPGLVGQVRAWQERAKLQWSEADILEVARHLDAAIYRLPQSARG
jgi:cytochrome c5